VTEQNNTVGTYIDKKADWAREKAKNGTDNEFYSHMAQVLDALADEIRMGLHEKS
jgi:hypothetical protein